MPRSRLLSAQPIFLWGIFLFLGGCQSGPPKTENAATISVEQLLANPWSHAHSMIKVSGCFVLGLESTTLRPCGAVEPGKAIWIENAKFVREMQKNRLPDVPDAMPKGLEKRANKEELFAYDERSNADAWKKLKPSSDGEQAVLDVLLLGQFEAAAQQGPAIAESGFGHLGAYSYELILADVLGSKPVQFSGQTEQSSKAINTTVCKVVEDPLPFVGKRVRISARFQSDGIEHTVLTDPACGRGILPFVPDEVERHPDIRALGRALDQGLRSTMDKSIVATFTGRFLFRDSYPSRLRFVLDIERIDDLSVTLINLKPHVPRKVQK